MLAGVGGCRRRWLRWVAGAAIGLVGLWYVPPVHDRFAVVAGLVGFVGISAGGSFALVAAAAPRIARSLGFVATFGAYFDLRHVIQGIPTHATIVHGRAVQWEPAPQAAGILRHQAE